MMGKLTPLRRIEGRPEELSDAALLAGCAIGDAAAQAALFDRHHDHVYRFLARLSGTDRRDLDDLVQVTFLEILRSARQFDGRASVRVWIFGVAANVARHHTRSEVRRKHLVQAVAAAPAPSSPARPDDVAEHREQVRRVARALGELPYDLRVVVVMCDLEGLAGVDVAKQLGVRPGTLWRRLHDARQALRVAITGAPRGGT